MFEFIKISDKFFLPLLTNIGLLALLAIAVSTASAKIYEPKRLITLTTTIIYGLSFGVAASILIHVPIELQEGIHGDGRGAVILLAGAIAGPISAAIASTIAAATRYELGGAGMPSGVLYIFIFGICGVLWRRLCNQLGVDMLSNRSLLAAPIIVTVLSSIVLFSFPDPQLRLIILGTIWPVLLISNVTGTIILGYLIRRERERFKAKQLAIEQRDRAEKATVAKTEFLSTMSHEIRTPLNGVLGILQLLEHETLPTSVTQKLKLARDSGFHLLTLVNQLLDIERIEAGALTSNPKQFKLDQLLDGLSSIFRTQADQKGLSFKVVQTTTDGMELIANYTHIQQILINLVGNAIKFTERGSVSVSAALESIHEDSALLRIKISDTGPGIPADYQSHIFERFGQAPLGKVTGGAGLGLSIATRLARNMNARLDLHSAPGEGTTFILFIPVQFAVRIETSASDPAPAISLKPLQVLIADDNAVNLAILEQMLTRLGHQTVMASSGREAIELATSPGASFDLILMDIQMPEMDGLAATAAIRRKLDGKELPIVALTANAFAEQRAIYLAAGMQDVLTKPLEEKALMRVLARYGERGDGSSSDTPAPTADPTLDETLNAEVVAQLLRIVPKKELTELLNNVVREATRLAAALEESSGTEVADRNLHELKGMLLNLGLTRAAEKCGNLEAFPRGDRAVWRQQISEMLGAVKEGCLLINAGHQKSSATR